MNFIYICIYFMWKKLKFVLELFFLLNCYYLLGIYLGRNGWEGSLSEFCLLFNFLKDFIVGSLKNNSVEM